MPRPVKSEPIETTPEGLAKGLLFRGVLDVLGSAFGPSTVKDVIARTPVRFQGQCNEGFIANAWYPEALLLDWYRALAVVVPEETQEQMGYLIQRHMLGRVYKIGVLLAGPDRALSFAPKGHSLYLTRGQLSYQSSGEGEGDLRYQNMPLADEPGFRLGIAGSYRALIEMSGARPLDVTVHKSQAGEARIHLRWAKK